MLFSHGLGWDTKVYWCFDKERKGKENTELSDIWYEMVILLVLIPGDRVRGRG